jgi:predicted RND superfamily exporter protein
VVDPWIFSLAALGLVGLGLAGATLRPAAVIDHPRLVLLALVLVTAAAGERLTVFSPLGFNIDIDPSSGPLLLRSDPSRALYRQAVLDFGTDDVYVIAVSTDDVFTSENLGRLRRLTEALRRLEGVRSVESLTRTLAIQQDDGLIEIGHFIEDVPDDPEGLADLRRRSLADPLHVGSLISADGRIAAINVSFHPMTDGDFVHLDLDAKIQQLVERTVGPDQRFYIAGRPHVRSQAYHIMVSDLAVLIPLAVAIAALCLWGMTGSTRGVLVPLTACLVATLWVFGAMATMGMNLNLITLVLPPMMICVGSVYGVHVVARYEEIAQHSTTRREAALGCLEYTRTPVLLAGVTTIIGFAALLLSDIPATNQLGISAVLGVASATLISLTGIPATLAMLPLERVSTANGARQYAGRNRFSNTFGAALDGLLSAVAGVVTRHRGRIIGLWAALSLTALILIPRIVVDTDIITFFLKSSRVRTDFEEVNRLLTGVVPIFVVFAGGEEGTFREPAVLRSMKRAQRELSELTGVSRVLSSVDLVERVHEALEQKDGGGDRLPQTRAGIAEAMFMLPKDQLRRFATSNHSRGNLIVRTGQAGSAAMRALETRIRDALADLSLPTGLKLEVTSNAIMLNRSADSIAGNQIAQVGIAAATIFLLICLVFGSLRLGLIAMVPNVVPIVIFFGILGSGIARLSLPTSLIGCIVLGIAIDDTMHFLVAYLKTRAETGSSEEALRVCIRGVGRPIVMTSIMLVVGFLVILVSGFATLREFGYLTALTMAICLTTDLVLLPAVLMRSRA